MHSAARPAVPPVLLIRADAYSEVSEELNRLSVPLSTSWALMAAFSSPLEKVSVRSFLDALYSIFKRAFSVLLRLRLAHAVLSGSVAAGSRWKVNVPLAADFSFPANACAISAFDAVPKSRFAYTEGVPGYTAIAFFDTRDSIRAETWRLRVLPLADSPV